MSKVLVIDDDQEMLDAVNRVAAQMEHDVRLAPTVEEGLEKLKAAPCDVALLNVNLPGGDAPAVVPDIQQSPSNPEVIVMTGNGDADGAEAAIRSGAWDYLEKPVSVQQIQQVISRALQYHEEAKHRQGPATLVDRVGIVGESPAIRSCLDEVAQAAMGDINVLVAGETGTGKELFAWAVHANSKRAERRANFVVVDCTALPKTLVESVLFGYEKGAYTGADRAKDGLIRQADGGTLFLDEVGELPLEIQKKFLRVLQERSYRPVGSRQEVKSDFRLIAATNRDLDDMVREGTFREDLLFRLRAMTIVLPPLRERREDIKMLALHHISVLCERYRTDTKGFSPDFFDTLSAYDWPGNVRELNQALEHALASAGPNPMLFPMDLPDEIRAKVIRKTFVENELRQSDGSGGGNGSVDFDLERPLPPLKTARTQALAHFEKQYLDILIKRTRGNIRKACVMSGLSRSRFYALVKRYRLSSSLSFIKAAQRDEKEQ